MITAIVAVTMTVMMRENTTAILYPHVTPRACNTPSNMCGIGSAVYTARRHSTSSGRFADIAAQSTLAKIRARVIILATREARKLKLKLIDGVNTTYKKSSATGTKCGQR